MSKYNREEWTKEQGEKRDEMTRTLQSLAQTHQRDPAQMAELIAFSSKFYNYSPTNTKLIYTQNEFATFVGSFQSFKEKGYSVNKGEKSIKIFVPVMVSYFERDGRPTRLSEATKEEKEKIRKKEIDVDKKMHFKIGSVFDIAQTDCPVEDYPTVFNMGYSSEEHATAIKDVTNYAVQKLGCPINEVDLKSLSLRGRYFPEINKIELNHLMDDTEKLSTLCHEVGHAVIHNSLHEKGEVHKSEHQIEFEADMFSIMLQDYVGLELTDGRKDHFAGHYRKFSEENELNEDEAKSVNFNDIMKDVFNHFEKCIHDINDIIEQSQGQELDAKQNTKLSQSEEIDL